MTGTNARSLASARQAPASVETNRLQDPVAGLAGRLVDLRSTGRTPPCFAATSEIIESREGEGDSFVLAFARASGRP
jgi:hypothetical protein